MDKDELRHEIAKRAPWYQRIEFEKYGISTLDDPSWGVLDGAPDNVLDDLTPQQAALQRPIPKWTYIKELIPNIRGLDVMEIGCANGFFSFQFSRLGAKHVYAVDRGSWMNNAPFAQKVLGIENITWIEADFFDIGFETSPLKNERSPDNVSTFVERPDVVFLSAAFVHFHYPFLALHKLVNLPKRYLILDEGYIGGISGADRAHATFFWQHTSKSHAFAMSPRMIKKYLWRLGISPQNVTQNFYPQSGTTKNKRCLIVVDTGADQSFVSDEDVAFFGGDDRQRRYLGTP